MKAGGQKSQYWLKSGGCAGLAVFFILTGANCASTQKTTKTVTVDRFIAESPEDTAAKGEDQNTGVVEKSETTTSTTATKAGHPGFISSTVHAIGWVISLPFRLIGGLIGWIF